MLGMMIDDMPANEVPDLMGCFDEARCKAITKYLAKAFKQNSSVPAVGAVLIMRDTYLEDYAERLEGDLNEALWQKFADDKELQAGRSMAELH